MRERGIDGEAPLPRRLLKANMFGTHWGIEPVANDAVMTIVPGLMVEYELLDE